MVDQAPAVSIHGPKVRIAFSGEDVLLRLCLIALALFLLIGLLLPIYTLLSKGLQDANGNFVGLLNFVTYFSEPRASVVFWNSLRISVLSTVLTLAIAGLYAFALTHSRMPGRVFFRAVALVPLLTPSLLPGIALIYLFGNQGFFRGALFGHSLYGPVGIVIGEVFFTFPIALLIVQTSLLTIDRRLYEAATALRAGRLRTFFTVTLPAMRFGLGAASFATFTKVFTDFGVPVVVGGSYPVLATDLYQKVIGGFDFQMGAVVGILLFIPAAVAFVAGHLLQRGRSASVDGRAVVYVPAKSQARDLACLLFCSVVALAILSILVMAVLGSLFKLWPYNLSLSFSSYNFAEYEPSGWGAYRNSLRLSGMVALFGTALVFFGAYLLERVPGASWLRQAIGFCCMIPLALPGMVLGLSYIFFFNSPSNPFGGIYGTIAILVLSTVVHLYTVPHLTALTALKQLDPGLEAVGSSLKVSRFATFGRVVVPVCLPTILRIASYLFMNSMTTISALVFLYSANTKVATVSVVLLNDNAMLGPAAAMSVLIVATSATVVGLQWLLMHGLLRRTQAWRGRES
ncbi:putative 2-aminoethylphosphonate ABC transporter permease subunit [Pseudaminobacter sp. 19-2017]|uniref:2-aminoethylphosphonate ABC transporter permease subunit n=1 Tax=Pseudaminobacter soli (ex Zhang et al. 2022) TaxID=2831468 RepID=A0A942E7T8_9HYPH|nr:putative 2-aminoethylphosphonate ABC transporter permease subunit [Pseudaminobacter soli]MBS3652526.1 putative 2-aminoethylphosphonate ABC transporter permease subunit [Pseudaminobacter soli]